MHDESDEGRSSVRSVAPLPGDGDTTRRPPVDPAWSGFETLGRSLAYGVAAGTGLGMVIGTAVGLLAGTFIGAIVGFCLGVPFGLVGGVALLLNHRWLKGRPEWAVAVTAVSSVALGIGLLIPTEIVGTSSGYVLCALPLAVVGGACGPRVLLGKQGLRAALGRQLSAGLDPRDRP